MQLILITGASASGKTQVAKGLLAHLHFIFGEDSACLISQDHYYHDLPQEPNEANPATNFDHPDALDFELLKEHINCLFSGKEIHMPLYDFATHSRLKQDESVKPCEITIVEGIHALYNNNLFDNATLIPEQIENAKKGNQKKNSMTKKTVIY